MAILGGAALDDPQTAGKTARTSRVNWGARARLGAMVIAVSALIAGTTAPVATATPVTQQSSQAGLVVHTTDGAVTGKTTGTTNEFLGIPYAAPPVGQLRWQPPQPAAPWKGVRDATQFAPHCAQPASDFGIASTSEDCLYLNVYTPTGQRPDARGFPVMVWIHGGAFIWGESDDYNPSALVSHGVIVVTINYRLGALGFLANASLAARPGGPSGDYGLMDQQAALHWVQQNIDQFGGNRHDVTLAGESSGGLSVLSQLASPGAGGLFAGAIVESGAYDLVPESLRTAELSGAAFASRAGCAGQAAACLRALPVRAILADQTPTGYRPDIDGQVLTHSLASAFASGRFARVPVIDGSNHDEYRLFVGIYQQYGERTTAANYQGLIAATLKVSATTAAVIAAAYPLTDYPSPSLALGAVGTDASFACPALSADESLSKYVPLYAYEYNVENAPERYLPPFGFPYGAAHESELQYLFDLQNTPNPGVLSPQQQQLAAAMQQYWTTFVAATSPSSPREPRWPQFHGSSQQVLSLGLPQPDTETDFATEHNCAFWAHAG
jgi:para-nitrobenzyl esterase